MTLEICDNLCHQEKHQVAANTTASQPVAFAVDPVSVGERLLPTDPNPPPCRRAGSDLAHGASNHDHHEMAHDRGCPVPARYGRRPWGPRPGALQRERRTAADR